MKAFTAVLHLKSKEPLKVYQLGGRVLTSLGTSPDLFTTPDPTLVVLTTELAKLDSLIKSKDGSKQINQAIDDQTELVYALLKDFIIYVNKIAKGDKTVIVLSGFDCNDEPVSRDIPGKALIKRVEDGSTACSAKIYAEALEYADRYKVEIATSIDGPWTTMLDFGSLNKLEIRDLIRGQTIYIRISGGNNYGWGIPSEPVVFIPR
ncbi:MAG TPA: fibronectin type III domain-containing protein [Paludibacter sp.]